jgi:hypothetical protein
MAHSWRNLLCAVIKARPREKRGALERAFAIALMARPWRTVTLVGEAIGYGGARLKIEINPRGTSAVNTGATTLAPAACGARTRLGPCQNLPEVGRTRCRLHGGAAGSGAPKGARNGRYVDGDHTKAAKAERQLLRQILSGDADMNTETATATPNATPARPRPITVEVYQGDQAGDFRVRPPANSSEEVWRQRIGHALGTLSTHFIEASLHRLLAACRLPGHCIPTSTGISAAIALIESLHPENEIQAALAVHIACLDAAGSNMLARLAWGGTESRTKVTSNAIAKLEHAFTRAIDTYRKFKNGNQQTIRIERMELQPGAQAVIGQVVR